MIFNCGVYGFPGDFWQLYSIVPHSKGRVGWKTPLLPGRDELSFAAEAPVLQPGCGEGALGGRGRLPAHRQRM